EWILFQMLIISLIIISLSSALIVVLIIISLSSALATTLIPCRTSISTPRLIRLTLGVFSILIVIIPVRIQYRNIFDHKFSYMNSLTLFIFICFTLYLTTYFNLITFCRILI